MLAAEYTAVLDYLQGEKDRLAAATAGAAGAGSSLGTQLPLQQQQQPVLQEAGGSGGFEAGNSSNSRPSAQLAQLQAGLQEVRLAGQLRASLDPESIAAAPGGMQAERPGSSSAAVAADEVSGCLICKHASSSAGQDSAVSAGTVRASAGGSTTEVAHGSPDGRHALQAQGVSHRWVVIAPVCRSCCLHPHAPGVESVFWQQ
jgi:hypothetical protein